MDKKNNHTTATRLRSLAVLFISFSFVQLPVGSLAAYKAYPISRVYPSDSLKGVFIQAVTSKSRVYKGEAFTVSYWLYNSGLNISDPEKEISFKFPNCYSEEYPAVATVKLKIVNGKPYNATLLKKFLIIPSTRGALKIPSITKEVNVEVPPGEEDTTKLFSDGSITKKITSKSKSVDVVPLPQNKDSIQFSGAIGHFSLSDNISKTSSEHLLNISVTVTGNGNMQFSDIKVPLLPRGIGSYNESNTESHTLTDSGLSVKHAFSFQATANYKGV